uniref:Uncharacterized protein n=1 Tax=Brassica oleracea TaxID=3712 RepID=A0A3P6CWH6_BRAOL|nr:unnamed protein product [Brassica oleracea]
MSISQFPPPASPSPSQSPASLSSSSSMRLWRPAAQSNRRNQWFVPAMKFGALSDMVGIKEKTLKKLSKQQSSYRIKASIFVQGNGVVVEMVNVSRSRRCYMKPSIIQFSGSKEDSDDAGDCGGIPVFNFLNVSAFEKMAEELVEMFKRRVILKESSGFLTIETFTVLRILTNY